MSSSVPKMTVIFLLYSEADYVPGLVSAILRQTSPQSDRQDDWMRVIFVDNGSRDDTLAVIQRELRRAGSPVHCRVIHHPTNQGIAGALNHAFKTVDTPYILTTHCDVLYGRDDYVYQMTQLLDLHPDAGAIAGQPAIPKKERIPFAEKVNLVANLMDIFPEEKPLVPVGFVEGRCDAFRVDALRAAGYYDTTLRVGGEDQVLAARMRQAGFHLYQAPELRYSLSVSSDQDSLIKLAHRQRLFGRTTPYILLRNRKAFAGVLGPEAGRNRQQRSFLRLTQPLSVAAYASSLALAVFGPAGAWVLPLLLIFALKHWIFSRHMESVSFSPAETVKFYLFQPALDFSYFFGLIHGLWLLVGRSEGEQIS